MKIKDVQKFKEEVHKNLMSIYFSGYNTKGCGETWFNDVEFESGKVTHLYDVAVEIEKYHWDANLTREIDETYYVSVNETGVDLWKSDVENKCYKWIDGVDAECEPNKTVFFMELAMIVMRGIGA